MRPRTVKNNGKARSGVGIVAEWGVEEKKESLGMRYFFFGDLRGLSIIPFEHSSPLEPNHPALRNIRLWNNINT